MTIDYNAIEKTEAKKDVGVTYFLVKKKDDPELFEKAMAILRKVPREVLTKAWIEDAYSNMFK